MPLKRDSFRVAVLALVIAAGGPSLAQDAPADAPSRIGEKCGDQNKVVLGTPDSGGPTVAVFCGDELRALGCRPLGLIRNYLLYSHGICLNNNEMYGYAFSRKGCETLDAQLKNNRQAYRTMPASVMAMVKQVKAIEVQKNCDYANEGEQ